MRMFPPKGSIGWTGPPELRPLIAKIMQRYPAAEDFEPCDCGLTLAVIPRENVHPTEHFLVEDDELRDEAARLIREHELSNANYANGALVLAERA